MTKIIFNLVNDSNIDLIRNATAEQIEQAMIAIASFGESCAVNEVDKYVYETPESPNYVRTYRLRDNITSVSDKVSATIGTDVEYAPYVEKGSRGMHPRPFLSSAIENYIDDYQEILERYLKNAPNNG